MTGSIAAWLRAANLRRGFRRLALAALATWFVFWTFAYVIHPFSSLRAEPSFAVRVTAWSVVAPCLAALLISGLWSAVGFRRNLRLPPARG